MTARIAVLVSGGGTNLAALIDAKKAGILKHGEISLVISSKRGAYALTRADQYNIPSMAIEKSDCKSDAEFDELVSNALHAHNIELIVLAGFTHILGKSFINDWQKRIINVHPSLIPSFCGKGFYGLKVHEQALRYGVKITGATVHYVNEIPDGGEIIMQKPVRVYPGDTPETLQKRVMREAEWIILPEATQLLAKQMVEERRGAEEGIQPMIYSLPMSAGEYLSKSGYIGRGIIIGKAKEKNLAVMAYFIMGRSENSRNRVFKQSGGELYIEPYIEDKSQDKSLIIYRPVRALKKSLIIANGNQSDSIYDELKTGKSFEKAVSGLLYEPDAPNYTPRISGLMSFDGGFRYTLNIAKKPDAKSEACIRQSFTYEPVAGVGHLISTYEGDGNPLPCFSGEPRPLAVSSDIDTFADEIWRGLYNVNKISLYVRVININSGEYDQRIINRHGE